MMFGPHDADSAHSGKSMQWKIKRESNDSLRQKFVDQTIPQIDVLKLEYPDPQIKWNESRGHYDFAELNWEEFYAVINGDGHCNRERIEHHVRAHEEGQWVRDALHAYNEKKRAKRAA